jgi:tetratricopeptide (TPR) repeat protein
MTCETVEERNLAEEYLLGRLDEDERRAFELHYFECSDCFERLRATQAVQQLLAQDPSAGAASTSPRWWAMGQGLAAAAAVVAIGVWLVHEPDGLTSSRAAVPAPTLPQAATRTPPPSTPAASVAILQELARFEPPAYTPASWRGASTPPPPAFRRAMARYVQKDYAAALTGLRAAVSQDPESPDAWFFLGASALLADEADAGIDALRRTLALGSTPYEEEAHFYLAKGLVRKGSVSAARDHLRKTVALGGDLESAARELLQRLPP